MRGGRVLAKCIVVYFWFLFNEKPETSGFELTFSARRAGHPRGGEFLLFLYNKSHAALANTGSGR